MLEAEITAGGDVTVEGQHVGHLHGFQFVPDPGAEGHEAKTLRSAAEKALAGEIEARAERFSAAADASLVLSHDGVVRWTGDPVAKLTPGDKLFEPHVRLLADEQLTGPARDKVEGRLTAWLKAHVVRLLGPLMEIETAADLTGLAKGIGYQVVESLGVLERSKVMHEMRTLDQEGRGALRRHGVRFGAYHIFLPALLKPAPRTLAAQLWALKNGGLDQRGLDEIAHLASSGRTSIKVDPEIAKGLYRAAGFRVCGERAVRVDILERLADLIRPAITYRPGTTPGEAPAGTADGDAFVATVGMTSLVGCSGEDFASILKSLGYAPETRPGPAITVPLLPAASTQPVQVTVPADETADEATGDDAAEGEAVEAAEGHDGAAADDAVIEPGATADAVASPLIENPIEAAVPEPATVSAEATSPETASEETASEEATSEEATTPETTSAETTSDETAGSTEAAPEPVAEAASLADAAEHPTEAVSADGVEGEAATSEGAEDEAAAAEIVTVEVWRLQRQQRSAPRQNRPRGGGRDRDGAAPNRAPGEGRPDQRRQAGAAASDGQGRPRGGAPGGERPEGGRREGGRPENGRPQRRERFEPGRTRPDRRDEPRAAPRDEPRPQRRERAPDPDSPFAKLAALKAQLEAGDGNKR